MHISLGEELARSGHRIYFIIDKQMHHLANNEPNPAIMVFPSPKPNNIRDYAFLTKLVLEHRPDCIITDSLNSKTITAVVGKLTGINCRIGWNLALQSQYQIRDSYSWLRSKVLIYRKYLFNKIFPMYMIANSEASYKELTGIFKIPPHLCKVFPRMIADPVVQYRLSKIDRKANIVCVARLDKDKGIEILLESIKYVKNEFPDVFVEFLGDGRNRIDYEKMVSELKIGDNVKFHGSVGRSTVFEKLASSAMLVLPSHSEAFGIVLIESMAVGTPCIGSNAGGIPEVFKNGEHGYYFEPGNSRDLANRICSLMEDCQLRKKFGDNCRSYFLEKYELSTNILRLSSWIEETVAKALLK
jgi:glycosyltransferase involved in cell wall biosynthesis